VKIVLADTRSLQNQVVLYIARHIADKVVGQYLWDVFLQQISSKYY